MLYSTCHYKKCNHSTRSYKNALLTLLCLLLASASFASKNSKSKILLALNIADENKKSIEDAQLRIRYQDKSLPAKQVEIKLSSDKSGLAFHRTTMQTPVAVNVEIEKAGYYPSKEIITVAFADKKLAKEAQTKQQIFRRRCILKAVKNPTPLHVSPLQGKTFNFPLDTTVGFDLLQADMLEPYGTGQNIDFFITISQEGSQEDRGESTRLTINFPNRGDGISSFSFDPTAGSHLQSNYQAPETKYVNIVERESLIRTNKKLGTIERIAYQRSGIGFYFRTRTQLGPDMQIVDGYYSKMYGDFIFDARKGVATLELGTVYFNPQALDRNLEFKIGENLSSERADAIVFQP